MINKNNLEMKTEKKEIGNIWKTFIPYVPMGWAWVFSEKYAYHGSTSTSNAIGVLTSFANTFLAGVYLTFFLGAGTPDFRKWSEINEQRKLQEEIQIQKNIFQKYDKNKDRYLDSTEFFKYYNKEKK